MHDDPVTQNGHTKLLPVFHARHHVAGTALDLTHILAGHKSTGTTRKQRLAELAGDVRLLLAEDLRATPDPLGLQLDVGLPHDAPLLTSNNLVTYLDPLVSRLTRASGRRFVTVWASKQYANESSISFFQARSTRDPGGIRQFQVRTTASIVTTAFRHQIRNQIAAARPLPDGGIALQLSFVVGPRRAWPNLWKVTIDSLSPLLEHTAHSGTPDEFDGRITDLGLHCVVDPDLGHNTIIGIRADSVAPARRKHPVLHAAVRP
jgi:hypothetical protein